MVPRICLFFQFSSHCQLSSKHCWSIVFEIVFLTSLLWHVSFLCTSWTCLVSTENVTKVKSMSKIDSLCLKKWHYWISLHIYTLSQLAFRTRRARAAFVMLKKIWASKGLAQEPNFVTSPPTWNRFCCMDAKHGERQRQCRRSSRHLSTHVWGTSTASDCQRWSQTKICWSERGQEPVAKQTLKRKFGWIGHTLLELKQQGLNSTEAAKIA